VGSYLDEILAHHRGLSCPSAAELAEAEASLASAPPLRDFAARLTASLEHPGRGAGGGLSIIAEFKRRSPSKGPIALEADPARVARDYERAGAACLSVLTDEAFFAGSSADLRRARAASTLPVLRKDFTVAHSDVVAARAMGADAILLIVAALDRRELAEYLAHARELGMEAVVEVHDEDELELALELKARVIGVNQRDLRSFEVDPGRACRLAGLMPDGVVSVAESGIRDRADLDRLAASGFTAALVGEALMTAPDRVAALTELRGPGRVARRPVSSEPRRGEPVAPSNRTGGGGTSHSNRGGAGEPGWSERAGLARGGTSCS
jgi:indole-3-glycerol phosphate synthase